MNMKNQQTVAGRKVAGRRWATEVALALALSVVASAAIASGGGDPLGDGVCKLVNILTGKWLFGFAILATLGAGSALLFGAEMTEMMKKVATVITGVGIILAMSSILALAFSKFSGITC